MIRKSPLKPNVQIYPMSNHVANKAAVRVFLPLAALLMEIMAWHILNNSCIGCAAVIAGLGLAFALLIVPLNRLIKTTVSVQTEGIGISSGEGRLVFIRWRDLTQVAEGRRFKSGLMVPGLTLFDESAKTKILIPLALQNYDELRERILKEWSKRFKPIPMPLAYRRFPFFYLKLGKEGVQLRRWFRTTLVPWNGITGVHWGFYYAFQKASRFSSFLQIETKEGRTFRIGSHPRLPEIFLILKKKLKSNPSVLASGELSVSEEGFSRSCWFSIAAGVLWAILPDPFVHEVWGFQFPKEVQTAIFLFFLITLYCSLAGAFIRRGLVVGGPVPKRSILSPVVFPLIVMATSYYLANTLDRSAAERFLEKVKKEAVDAGYRLGSPENLPKLQDGENAVYDLKKIPEVKSAEPILYSDTKHPGSLKPFYGKKTQQDFLDDFIKNLLWGGVSPDELFYGRKLLQVQSETLALLDNAYRKNKVDWGMDFSLSPEKIENPHMVGFLNLSRLLICRSLYQAREGKGPEALDSLKASLFLGDAAQSSKTLIGEMIQVAIYRMVLSRAPYILDRVSASLVEKHFLPVLQPDKISAGYMAALQYEYFGRNQWWDMFRFGSHRPAYATWEKAYYYEYQIHKLKALALPYSQREAAWKKGEAEEASSEWFYFADRNYEMFNKVLEAVAYCRLARVGTEARMFKMKNKDYPDAVWQVKGLGMADTQDPFTDGNNFRIMRYGKGIMIYSLGPDGVDNQGQPKGFNDHLERYNPSWIVEE